MNDFLDLSGPSTGQGARPSTRPSTGAAAGAAAGGAAAAFLNSPDNRQGRQGQRADTRQGRQGERTATRDGRQGERADRRADRADNRPDRIENRGERQEQRNNRRDEVRDQFRDHHPRYDFWKDHPNWARWRWNRPYRWATWGLITGFFPWGWSEPSSYAYGDNVYYEDDTVYYGENAVASSDEYAQQAQTLVETAPQVDDEVEWLTLGVFAITQDGEESGPPPTLFVQLAVNKQGIIAGTFQNTATEDSQAVEGMVDKESQRSAWGITGKNWPIMETGVSNLTKDTAPALVHFEDGQTQQWLLVRLEEPESEAASN